MSLKSNKLSSKYHSGKVFIPGEKERAIPFIPFIALSVTTGCDGVILARFEREYAFDSEIALISAIGNVDLRAKMLISFVAKTLKSDPKELVTYFVSLSKNRNFEEVIMDIPDDKFFVLLAAEENCIIVANPKDISIKPLADKPKSDNLTRILKSEKGYRTYRQDVLNVVNFEDVLEYESIELGNTSIYAYLSENYDAIADMHIPYTSEISEDLCRYFNSRIIDILSKEYDCNFGDMPCCWVCDSEDAVQDYYIKPFSEMSSDICDIFFSDKMIPLCDLGRQGCLIAAKNIELAVKEIAPKTQETRTEKTSIFSRDAEEGSDLELLGIPVEEDGFALAVDFDSFIRKCHRHPTDADKSKVYQELYLLRDIPNVAIWDKCKNSRTLFTVWIDSYGVKTIKTTDIPVKRY